MLKKLSALILFLTILVSGCMMIAVDVPLIIDDQLIATFDRDMIILASDKFAGRLPGSAGGEMAVDYISRRFKEIGLEPGNGDSYHQPVPFFESMPSDGSNLTFTGLNISSTAVLGEDFVGRMGSFADSVSLDSAQVVFVGYGVSALEYDWDDYGTYDVAGKIVLMLRGDPGFHSGDSTLFNGKGSSRYGSFRAKFVTARDRGAIAAFVIFDSTLSLTKYNWSAARRYINKHHLAIDDGDTADGSRHAEGMFSVEYGRSLLTSSGYDYDSLAVAAARRDFKAFPLAVTAKGVIKSRQRRFDSPNIVGILPGSERPDEVVVYMGHWDHLGTDTSLTGDQIYNGASDNATGIAGILALAREFVTRPRPERSIVFLALTAEESGLLGSRYYCRHPVYPLALTAAALNIDMLVSAGQTRDVIIFGQGKSELEGYVERAAAKLGMVVGDDPWPEQNIFYRSDHISFARQGVPALFMTAGVDLLAQGRAGGLEFADHFLQNTYHSVTDEYNSDWDLRGIADYLQIIYDVGYTIAHQTYFPNWNRYNEFRAIRDQSVKEAKLAPVASVID
ncbi:MAG: M20/M25/M40 family metallo-hydrolase [Candidatus Marinimicrobia bacterium]|nr:M20/M25/M40 family metallo-hydrolase [Candidatus Neomarinimicrobiota bacterium]